MYLIFFMRTIKIFKYRCITQTTTWPMWCGPLSSVINSFSALLQRHGGVYFSDPISCSSKTQLEEGTRSPLRAQSYVYLVTNLYSFTLIIDSSQSDHNNKYLFRKPTKEAWVQWKESWIRRNYSRPMKARRMLFNSYR